MAFDQNYEEKIEKDEAQLYGMIYTFVTNEDGAKHYTVKPVVNKEMNLYYEIQKRKDSEEEYSLLRKYMPSAEFDTPAGESGYLYIYIKKNNDTQDSGTIQIHY